MDEIEIPHYIDAQPQIFFWELDEFVPIFSLMAVGIATDALTPLIPFMFLFSHLFARFKSSQMEGVLMHLVYWYGILPLNRVFKNGMSREYAS